MKAFRGEIHPAAELFPLIEGDDFEQLVESIRAHGLEQPIVLDQHGVLLDGRNRLRACKAAEIDPSFTTYHGADVIDYIVRVNVYRRHLTIGQRALIALETLPFFEAEARARQSASLNKGPVRADLPQRADGGKARDAAASGVGVSGRAVAQAKRVKEWAPDLVEQVRSGEMSLDHADREAGQRQREAKAPDALDVEAMLLAPETVEKSALDVRPGDVVIDEDGLAHPVVEIEELDDEIVMIDADGDSLITGKDKRLPVTKPDLGGGISHPARYSDALLPIFIDILARHDVGPELLDPFAGTGRIHELQQADYITIGIELEPEWAELHPDTICGSALEIPFEDEGFDAVVTSPTYGNRLADSYNAADPDMRRSYRFDLGRELSDDNSGAMQWGDEYRDFHERAWIEAARVLRPGGLFLLNIKDHIRDGGRQPVAGWHVTTLCRLGFTLLEHQDVDTPQLKQGANSALRFTEQIYVLTKDKS